MMKKFLLLALIVVAREAAAEDADASANTPRGSKPFGFTRDPTPVFWDRKV